MNGSTTKLLEIIEAIYREEKSDRVWLDGILSAAKPALDQGSGLIGFPFAATPSGLVVPWVRLLKTPTSVKQQTIKSLLGLIRDSAQVSSTYRSVACATGSEVGFTKQQPWRVLAKVNVMDCLAINGFDTTGQGIFFGPLLPRPTKLTPSFRLRFSRVAAHLGVGQRYRNLIKANKQQPDAVFEPGGKLAHAEGDATKRGAREALTRAVAAIDRARGRQRRIDPDGALSAWEGLVAARWSLVDQFESDGRRYVVARENEPFRTPLPILSKRERQVVGYLALGHANKLIAYELGISVSTVGVLLHRAAQKLHVKTRAELAAAFVSAASNAQPKD